MRILSKLDYYSAIGYLGTLISLEAPRAHFLQIRQLPQSVYTKKHNREDKLDEATASR